MDLTGKCKFQWAPEQQKAFDAMKALGSKDGFLHFLDIYLPFHMYTDARDYQLGVIILQEEHPVAFYSCKLTLAQSCYSNYIPLTWNCSL